MLKLSDLVMREDFSLGPLWVSPALRSVKGPAGEMHIEPLTMQVFLLLADAKGQVVTRNRLYDECWGGVNVGDYSLNRTITMVRRIAAQTAPGSFRIESIPRTGYRLLFDQLADDEDKSSGRKLRFLVLPGVSLFVLLSLGASAWFFYGREPHEPTVAVTATPDARAAELADGIMGAMMTTAAQYEVPVRLLAGSDAINARADFILRVQEAPGADPHVKLTLVSADRKTILWSWSAKRDQGEGAPPEQKAQVIGALVLTCAAETRAPGNRPPDQETVKLYLNACSKFEPWEGAQLALLPDSFQKVTERAPQLRGAWSKLFLSKAEAIEGFPPIDLVASLKKDIRSSEVHNIDVPEIYIARAAVLPLNARFERLQLYETGLARHPRNPFLMAFRSWQLRSVGRMDEAARTAGRFVALYPQSSAASGEYAKSLMHSGRLQAARTVLEKAERSAPDAANLENSRWILEMRYGDPKLALSIARSGRSVVDTSMIRFLQARINPTKTNIDHAIEDLRAEYRAEPREPGLLAQALSSFGRAGDAIELLLHYDGSNSGDGAEMLFRPHMREVRRDPRFILIARNFGVADYWIKSGILPDFCYEPGFPYDCKRELAKVGNRNKAYSKIL